MNLDIFNSTKNWQFSSVDEQAECKFDLSVSEARMNAPEEFYHLHTLTHLDFMRKTDLYGLLKTLPKAVMHHNHVDCNEDQEFYRQHIITDPNVYLAKNGKTLHIGNSQQASEGGWISMADAKQLYPNEDLFVQVVSNITMFNKAEIQLLAGKQKIMWDAFQLKIMNFFVIYLSLHIFKKYINHVLLKYIRNGYDRIEFRAFLSQLNEYDQNGNLIKTHDQKTFMDAFDQVYHQVRKTHPHFTAGFVFFGLKFFSAEQNQALFTKICQLNWDKTIGLDFVQQEDLFGSLEEYDKVVDKVLAKYPQLDYKKVYHAGQTKDHRTHNIDIAVKAGSVRIGHGLNILQRLEFLPHCKNICFEKNPISNLILGYKNDTREASAPVLLGLGYAVTINPDDPGKFGVEDTTADYFVATLSYNWTLRHLKLIAYHSINHAICQEHVKHQILTSFNQKWHAWVCQFVGTQNIKVPHQFVQPDIFTNTNHWSFSSKDQLATQKFTKIQFETIDKLPEDFYHLKVLNYLDVMKNSALFKLLHTLPKGALHHDHFDCNEDQDFYRLHIINDPLVYLTENKKSFQIGTIQQAQQNKWVSFSSYRKEFQNQSSFVKAVANLSMINQNEMEEISGNAKKFWVPFEQKILNFFTILYARHIFKKYIKHVLQKFIRNGYDRIEFRAFLSKLKGYDEEGNLIKQYREKEYTIAFDEVFDEVKKDHPNLSVGFIFFGLKALSDEQNEAILTRVCQLNWDKTIGLDFVQEEDPYGSIDKYDRVADKVLMNFPHLPYKKVYHAGDTKNHLNDNIEIAVKAGSVRIGHGLNIIQRIQFLPHCKNVCFELNPISNLITGSTARTDLRLSTAPILLGLGYPVSISPDDPGKFGYDDTTVDYFVSAVSFNWTLKHLKLVAIHSINHAICTEGVKKKLHLTFEKRWNAWVDEFLQQI